MISLLLAGAAAAGVHLLLTPSRTRRRADSRSGRLSTGARLRVLLDQAGLEDVSPMQFVAASVLAAVVGTLPAMAAFGSGPSMLLVAAVCGLVPAAAWRRRRDVARRAAQDAWPRLIEEIRVLTGSGGRSVPQALLDVGLRGPEETRGAFVAAQREWALTTDFERTVGVLTERLADPTADATCETLLVAAEVGGDLDRRLRALAEDRRQDLLGRKEARARQAGARLARVFVVLVPAGMALAGLRVGDGAAAFRSPQGQVLATGAIALVVACWVWASRIMRLPEQGRVFGR